MIVDPLEDKARNVSGTPVTLRLIGVLDRIVVESFSDSCAALVLTGARTLIVLVRDLTVMRDEHLERFLAILAALRSAGHRVFVNGSPMWRKAARAFGAKFEPSTRVDGQMTRRLIIICHSLGNRAGAAP